MRITNFHQRPERNMQILQRRADWLTKRIEEAGKEVNFDVAEREALLWAIEQLKQWVVFNEAET